MRIRRLKFKLCSCILTWLCSTAGLRVIRKLPATSQLPNRRPAHKTLYVAFVPVGI